MRGPTIIVLPLAAFALQGCLAKTALDIATAPVKIASKAVDLATTSQSEADEKRGREMRKREERLGQLQRERATMERKCVAERDRRACDALPAINAEISVLLPGSEAGPDR